MRIDEFLLARIAEREMAWRMDLKVSASEFTARSVALGLGECEAKRRIVEAAVRAGDDGHYRAWYVSADGPAIYTGHPQYLATIAYGKTLRILAAIWSDHPDYDPAWTDLR